MTTWRLVFELGAERALQALDPPIQKRIRGGYRMRVGDWRVVYSLDQREVIVLVLRIGHRREVYRYAARRPPT